MIQPDPAPGGFFIQFNTRLTTVTGYSGCRARVRLLEYIAPRNFQVYRWGYAMAKVTPSRQQYLDFKSQFPDAIVMFRLGDFYEMFDDDAEVASRELDLVLTGRPVAKGERVPMCGVPHHAVEGYIARLVEKGYHVAVIEQVGQLLHVM